eukprot:scaffold44213_cov50-Phaeocystis_antarctica.AAC.5
MVKVAWLAAQPRAATSAPEAHLLAQGCSLGPRGRALAAWVPKRGRCGALVPACPTSLILLPLTIQAVLAPGAVAAAAAAGPALRIYGHGFPEDEGPGVQ